jgi:hypothetical protein
MSSIKKPSRTKKNAADSLEEEFCIIENSPLLESRLKLASSGLYSKNTAGSQTSPAHP